MKTIKIMSVLMLSAVLTACGGGVGTEPSAYTAKVFPIEGDFDRYETVGPFSSRDECCWIFLRTKDKLKQDKWYFNPRHF